MHYLFPLGGVFKKPPQQTQQEKPPKQNLNAQASDIPERCYTETSLREDLMEYGNDTEVLFKKVQVVKNAIDVYRAYLNIASEIKNKIDNQCIKLINKCIFNGQDAEELKDKIDKFYNLSNTYQSVDTTITNELVSVYESIMKKSTKYAVIITNDEVSELSKTLEDILKKLDDANFNQQNNMQKTFNEMNIVESCKTKVEATDEQRLNLIKSPASAYSKLKQDLNLSYEDIKKKLTTHLKNIAESIEQYEPKDIFKYNLECIEKSLDLYCNKGKSDDKKIDIKDIEYAMEQMMNLNEYSNNEPTVKYLQKHLNNRLDEQKHSMVIQYNQENKRWYLIIKDNTKNSELSAYTKGGLKYVKPNALLLLFNRDKKFIGREKIVTVSQIQVPITMHNPTKLHSIKNNHPEYNKVFQERLESEQTWKKVTATRYKIDNSDEIQQEEFSFYYMSYLGKPLYTFTNKFNTDQQKLEIIRKIRAKFNINTTNDVKLENMLYGENLWVSFIDSTEKATTFTTKNNKKYGAEYKNGEGEFDDEIYQITAPYNRLLGLAASCYRLWGNENQYPEGMTNDQYEEKLELNPQNPFADILQKCYQEELKPQDLLQLIDNNIVERWEQINQQQN